MNFRQSGKNWDLDMKSKRFPTESVWREDSWLVIRGQRGIFKLPQGEAIGFMCSLLQF